VYRRWGFWLQPHILLVTWSPDETLPIFWPTCLAIRHTHLSNRQPWAPAEHLSNSLQICSIKTHDTNTSAQPVLMWTHKAPVRLYWKRTNNRESLATPGFRTVTYRDTTEGHGAPRVLSLISCYADHVRKYRVFILRRWIPGRKCWTGLRPACFYQPVPKPLPCSFDVLRQMP